MAVRVHQTDAASTTRLRVTLAFHFSDRWMPAANHVTQAESHHLPGLC